MIRLTPVSIVHQDLISKWYKNDGEGQKELGLYKDLYSWLKLLNPISRFGWIAFDDDQALGFVDLEKEFPQTGYFSFYIEPELRGQGYSKKLLQAIIKEAKKLGISQLKAGVQESNVPSVKALESAGFMQNGRDKDNYFIYQISL